MYKNQKRTKITKVEYKTLVDFQENLVDLIDENEDHYLTELLSDVDDYIKEFEDVHLGDTSISLDVLDIDYEAIYEVLMNDNWQPNVFSVSGMVKKGDESLNFNGYIDVGKNSMYFSDPIRKYICSVSLTSFSEWTLKYDDRLFSRYLDWLFKTGNYWIQTDLHKRFNDDVKQYLEENANEIK